MALCYLRCDQTSLAGGFWHGTTSSSSCEGKEQKKLFEKQLFAPVAQWLRLFNSTLNHNFRRNVLLSALKWIYGEYTRQRTTFPNMRTAPTLRNTQKHDLQRADRVNGF